MKEMRGGSSDIPRRTLFAAFFTVAPPTGGASAVTWQLARHWPGKRMLVQIGPETIRLEVEPGLEQVTLRQASTGGELRKFLQVPGWSRRIAKLAAQFKADTIVLEGASWAVYHWLLLGLLRFVAPTARIVYHAHNVEYDLRRTRRSWPIPWLTRLAEGSVVRGADVVTAVSTIDAERLTALYRRAPLLLPNGVDLAWIRSATPGTIEAIRQRFGLPQETVLFMGAYGYLPNAEAIDFLMRDVFPLIVERIPSARLLILGGEVPYREPWLVAPGLVPAEMLPTLIASAAVSVAPIFSGSGTRLKIIESLAAGVPVVATAKGAEGLQVEGCEDFMWAETAAEFVDALAEKLSTPVRSRQLKPCAMVMQLSWPLIVDDLMNEIMKYIRYQSRQR